MLRSKKYTDIYFLLFNMSLFLFITFFVFQLDNLSLKNYILTGLMFFVILMSYFQNIVAGLIFSAFIIFGYSSYLIYQNVFLGIPYNTIDYGWMIIYPTFAVIVGIFGTNIKKLMQRNERLETELKEYTTIDSNTGLGNMRSFYIDLSEEMSRALRYEFPLTLMLIQIEYFDEIVAVYGRKKIELITKEISKSLKVKTRNEDKRYKVNQELFAIIMPNTDKVGAEVLQDRIRSKLENLRIARDGEEEILNLDIKIGIIQYSDKVENALHFKELAEKELEFDV